MTTPNPACNVNGGSPPANVAASSTVTGGLVSTAGAKFWSLTCTDCDETNSIAAIQATLSVNQGTKTFSFTAPSSLGSAVQLTSTVGVLGLGLDANGIAQKSFTTTFKVNVLTAGALAVMTANETFEQNATFGWTGIVNSTARAPGAGSPIFVNGLTNVAGPTSGRGILHVDGYASVGDGGGGIFYWDPNHVGAGDNILTVVPGGGSGPAWTRQWDQKQIDIRWGGAQPVVTTDANTALIQAVINLAGSHYDVFFPPGLIFFPTYPLLVKAASACICGAYNDLGGSFDRSELAVNGAYGGQIFSIVQDQFLAGGTPTYVNRNGFDWFVSGTVPNVSQTAYINLGEFPYCALNGLTQFTAEAMLRVTGTISSNNVIIVSSGRKTQSTSTTSALQFTIKDLGSNNYGLGAVLQTTGGQYIFDTASTTIWSGTTTDVKVALTYDSTASPGVIRLYAGTLAGGTMSLVASHNTAGTGETIVQQNWENFNQGVVFARRFNQNATTTPPNYQITGLRLSDSARYTASSYTVETSPLTYDSNTMELFTFAPSTRFDTNMIKSPSKYLIPAGAYVYHEYNGNKFPAGGAMTIRDLSLQNGYGFGIRVDAVSNCRFERNQYTCIVGLYLYNNCFNFVSRDSWLNSTKGLGVPSALFGYGAAILLRDACGLGEINTCQVRGSWMWAFVAVNGCDTRYTKNYNLSQQLGCYYIGSSNCDFIEEFPTDEGGTITEACMVLDGCNKIWARGNQMQNNTAVSGAKLILIDGGGDINFDMIYASKSIAGSVPAFSFVSAPTRPVVANGINSTAINAAADMVDSTAPGLITTSGDTQGLQTIDFAADANQTSTDNQFTLWGTTCFTDNAHNLTATRTWTIPYISVSGYKRTWMNETHQSIIIAGTSGTTVTIASGKSATTITRGGNVVRLTPDT